MMKAFGNGQCERGMTEVSLGRGTWDLNHRLLDQGDVQSVRSPSPITGNGTWQARPGVEACLMFTDVNYFR